MGSCARQALRVTERLRLRRRPEPNGRRPRWWVQFGLVAVFLWAVDAVDKFRAGAQAAGLAHAPAIESVSRCLGGGIGFPMNQWLASHPLPAAAAAAYYIVPNVAVTGAAGLLLLRWRPPRFALHRNALIGMGLIALVAWWLYPVAPPRMLPGYHDITAAAVPVFAHLLESNAADQFAALPSIHVAWALWVALAAQSLLRRRLWRIAVWVYPALTIFDVVATANHYMLDVITAPVVVLLAYGLAALVPLMAVLPVSLSRARPSVRALSQARARRGARRWRLREVAWREHGPLPSQSVAGRTRKLPLPGIDPKPSLNGHTVQTMSVNGCP